jgi:Flp pilus assembly protein TadG
MLKRKRKQKEEGQAMVEFALVAPIFIMLLCFIIDFGWVFTCRNELVSMAGQVARDTAIHGTESTSQLVTREKKFIADNAKFGNPQIKSLSINTTTGYASVTLTENAQYITGFTGVITGGSNSKTLTATASAPVDPYQ